MNIVLIACLAAAALTALGVYLLLQPRAEKTVLVSRQRRQEFPTLPGPIAVVLGNITGWRLANRNLDSPELKELLDYNSSDYSPVQVRAIQILSAGVGLAIGAAAGYLAGLAGVGDPVAVAACAATGGLIVGFMYYPQRLKRVMRTRRAQVDAGLTQYARIMLMAIESGKSVAGAQKSVVQFLNSPALSEELSRSVEQMNSGVSFADAMEEFVTRHPSGDSRAIFEALLSMESDGLLRTDSLVATIREIHQRRMTTAEERSQKEQSKVTAVFGLATMVCLVLPFIFAIAYPIVSSGGGLGF